LTVAGCEAYEREWDRLVGTRVIRIATDEADEVAVETFHRGRYGLREATAGAWRRPATLVIIRCSSPKASPIHLTISSQSSNRRSRSRPHRGPEESDGPSPDYP